jgi:hypothetical protein
MDHFGRMQADQRLEEGAYHLFQGSWLIPGDLPYRHIIGCVPRSSDIQAGGPNSSGQGGPLLCTSLCKPDDLTDVSVSVVLRRSITYVMTE